MHICREEVIALIHDVDTALEVTTVSINDESILNIMAIVLWLPNSVECFDVKRVNLTSLAWCHFIATISSDPLNNCVSVWVSKTRWRGYLRARVANKLSAVERNVAYKLSGKLIVRYVLASTWNVALRESEC